jgi:uncharacterized YccA/Bax inhibitor family protein
VRTSSNPAFRNLPAGRGGYAGFDDRIGGGASPQMGVPAGYGRAQVAERPLTVDDVVVKTSITGGVALAAGILTAVSGMFWLALPGFVVGLVVSLIVIFRRSTNPALVITYSVAMGLALGGISGALDTVYPGVAAQAVIGTVGVFFGMLVVYKTGAVKVTPRFTKWLMGALVGVLVLMLANWVATLFTPAGLGLRSGGTLAIIFSLVVIGVAAFSLLLDFDQADRLIRAGAPARMAWYVAFGLMTTLVWLYLEILRLLSYMQRSN